MSEDLTEKEVLLDKIKAKRKQISVYLAKNEPRHSSLLVSSIITSALAAALTTGPGVGGERFIKTVANVISPGLPIWQLLCITATLLSIVAVVSNSVLKSYDMTSKIASARSCDAKLEGIQTLLELGQIELEQATQHYTQCLTEIPHIPHSSGARR